MNTSTRQDEIAALLRQAKAAHLQAFAVVHGADPDWPQWYAAYLQEPLTRLLASSPSPDELAACLVEVDAEQRAQAPDAEWPAYYATWFLARYGPSGP